MALLGGHRTVRAADEPAVRVLADFEGRSVAVTLSDVLGIARRDCSIDLAALPARSKRSLRLVIGATSDDTTVDYTLSFRVGTRFDRIDRLAMWCWLDAGRVELTFILRDQHGRMVQTRTLAHHAEPRWVRLSFAASAAQLKPLQRLAAEPLDAAALKQIPAAAPPLEVVGFRIRTFGRGQHIVFLDDFEVEHHIPRTQLVHGEFLIDEPTHMYDPGRTVRARLSLENLSRRRDLDLNVDMSWRHLDGREIKSTRALVNLPSSGANYRARQSVDFDLRFDEPGLYQLVAQVSAARWNAPASFETLVAVTPSNRGLPRGRASFFAVRSNLLREPFADQMLEIDAARRMGVQLLAIDVPWRSLESRPGEFDFGALDPVVSKIAELDIAAQLTLVDPPPWVATQAAGAAERQGQVFEALARRYGPKLQFLQPVADIGNLQEVDGYRHRLATLRAAPQIVPSPLRLIEDADRIAETLSKPNHAAVSIATDSSSSAASHAFSALARQSGIAWSGTRWFHAEPPMSGSGTITDAVAVLRLYVEAARAGVTSVVWHDLRDDGNDADYDLRHMRGIIRRDFSPKTPVLGFSTAIGMLHGLIYTGEVTPPVDGFDAAVFLAGNRQVIVLLPQPNHTHPAVVAPIQAAPGTMSAFDFERRPLESLESDGPLLLRAASGPMFITLDTERARTEPSIWLARPWVRAPDVVYCDRKTSFTVELDAPMKLPRSAYLQLVLPDGAPLRSSFSVKRLKASAGQTITQTIELTRIGNEPLEPLELMLRVALDRKPLSLPIRVQSSGRSESSKK